MLWDDTFAREGATIMAARQRAVRRLGDLAAESHVRLSGSALELLELAYQPQLGEQWTGVLPDEATAASVQPLLVEALAAQRRRETAAGLSLVGPHRDDVAILLNGVAAAAFGSRAQIRTAALSMRLAEAELLRGGGDAPVLLLDDILSEMDEKRRTRCWRAGRVRPGVDHGDFGVGTAGAVPGVGNRVCRRGGDCGSGVGGWPAAFCLWLLVVVGCYDRGVIFA